MYPISTDLDILYFLILIRISSSPHSTDGELYIFGACNCVFDKITNTHSNAGLIKARRREATAKQMLEMLFQINVANRRRRGEIEIRKPHTCELRPASHRTSGKSCFLPLFIRFVIGTLHTLAHGNRTIRSKSSLTILFLNHRENMNVTRTSRNKFYHIKIRLASTMSGDTKCEQIVQ